MPRRKRTPVEKVQEGFIKDLKEITVEMVRSRARPTAISVPQNILPKEVKKLTRKQKAVLAKGRKILALKRGQSNVGG